MARNFPLSQPATHNPQTLNPQPSAQKAAAPGKPVLDRKIFSGADPSNMRTTLAWLKVCMSGAGGGGVRFVDLVGCCKSETRRAGGGVVGVARRWCAFLRRDVVVFWLCASLRRSAAWNFLGGGFSRVWGWVHVVGLQGHHGSVLGYLDAIGFDAEWRRRLKDEA